MMSALLSTAVQTERPFAYAKDDKATTQPTTISNYSLLYTNLKRGLPCGSPPRLLYIGVILLYYRVV
mgnify:CR=1 FL=1